MTSNDQDSFNIWNGDEQLNGPLEFATLVQWIQQKRVLPDTFVQAQSDRRWRRAADVAGLRSGFPAMRNERQGDSAAVAATLREFALFADLTPDGVEQIAALGRTFAVAPGELVVQQGEPADAIYLLLAGELRVRLMIGEVDRMDKTLCKLGRGEFFGELGMFLKSNRTSDVLAESPSQVFRMTTNAFQLLVRQIPELASPVLFSLGATMARRISEDNQRFTREVTSQFVWV